MQFDIFSIIFSVIIILSLIVGLKKGFFKILIRLIKSFLSFALAVAFCKTLANVLMGTVVGEMIQNSLNNAFINHSDIFALTLTESNKAEVLTYALQELNIPSFLNNLLVGYIGDLIVINGEINIAEALSTSIAYFVLVAISFIVIYLAILILFSIKNKIFEKIAKLPLIGPLNRLLGAALNCLFGLFVICMITFGITLFVPISPTFASWFAETIKLNDPEAFTLAKFFYENNFLVKILELLS